MKPGALAAGVLLSALALPVGPARAATPSHVAIVVSYHGTTVARCAPVLSSGLADLQSEYQVVIGQPPSPYAGFVFSIDGNGTTHPDDTHYWAYYHRSNGSWVYSGVGAASYQPAPGSVEGWAYDDGGSSAPTPAGRSYASVCGGFDAPAPASTTAAPPKPRPSTAHPSRAAPRPTAARTPTHHTAAPAPVRSRAPRRHVTALNPAAPTRRSRPAAATSRSTVRTPATTPPSQRPLAAAAASSSRSPRGVASAHPAAQRAAQAGGGNGPLAAGAAVAIVALVGAAAWWRLRAGGRR